MIYDVSFSIATLVRVFRNIKNIRNYNFYIYANGEIGVRNIYLLVTTGGCFFKTFSFHDSISNLENPEFLLFL